MLGLVDSWRARYVHALCRSDRDGPLLTVVVAVSLPIAATTAPHPPPTTIDATNRCSTSRSR